MLGSLPRSSLAADYEYTVRDGDTLIGIAQAYLAQPAEWPRLRTVNRIANPRRLRPGSTLLIPIELLREESGKTSVVSASGDAAGGDGVRLQPGTEIAPGTSLRTGATGTATLRTPEGALITLQPRSEVQVTAVSRYFNTGIIKTVVRMISGRLEALVDKLSGPSRFEVQTELAIAGVRGTRFRVAYDGTARRAQTEVLEGEVGFSGVGSPAAVTVATGFGSVTDASGRPQTAVALLPAPRFDDRDALQERLVTRFRFEALPGAAGYRAQIASDAEFRLEVIESMFTSAEIKFADLADGAYFLRARAIDAQGLEGRDTVVAFRLKARPEPPLVSSPAPDGKVRATSVVLEWASNPEAASYRLQIAEDDEFKRVAQDEVVTEVRFESKLLPFGEYYFRVRSIRGTGVGSAAADPGPWGDIRKFVLRPPPKTPEPPEEGANELSFAWGAEPGQKFRFQVARDAQFTGLVEDREIAEPRARLPRPPQGIYYVRIRATDPDGFVGPFTAPQRFEVINRVIDSTGANLTTSDGQPVRLQ